MASSLHTMTASKTSPPVVSASTLHSRLLSSNSSTEATTKERSYLSRLPIDPFRLAIILLLVISALTISALNNDLDGQLITRQKIAEKLGYTKSAKFGIGRAIQNPPNKWYMEGPVASGIAVVIGLIFAGLMV